MPFHQKTTSIAAASTNDNLLTGTNYLYMPYHARVDFGLNGDANGTDLVVDVNSGSDIVAEQFTPNVLDRMPIFPDDYVFSDVVGAGEMLRIRVRNTHASTARTIYCGLRITPLV